MIRQDYSEFIDEMKIPSSKIFHWANIVKKDFHAQYRTTNQELFDGMLQATKKLVDLLPTLQLANSDLGAHVFTHELGGPIMRIRDNMTLILALHKKLEENGTEKEKEFFHYLKKIYSAAEYLSSLDRDVVLKITLDRINSEETHSQDSNE